jgi:DNA-binding response OmpR family regulator
VEEATSVAEALQRLQAGQVDLLLVCHTVPTSDRKRLIAAAHARQTLLPVICLIAREGDSVADCINVENTPAALLDSIATVAGFQPSRSQTQPRIRQAD